MSTDWQSKYKAEVEKRQNSHKVWKEQYQKLSNLVADLQKENELLRKEKHSNNYLIIDLLSKLVDSLESSRSYPKNYSIRMADHATILAHSLGMSVQESRDIYVATLMNNIGVLLSNKDVPNRILDELPEEYKKIILTSPKIAFDILSSCKELMNSAELAYSSRERIDGSGYPNGTAMSKIPKGSLIISIVIDYFEIMNGFFRHDKVQPEQAFSYMRKGRDYFYDRIIVDKFISILSCEYNQASRLEAKYRVNMLKVGMTLSRPLTNQNGSILLHQDHILTKENIENLLKIEGESEEIFLVFIKKDQT